MEIKVIDNADLDDSYDQLATEHPHDLILKALGNILTGQPPRIFNKQDNILVLLNNL